MPRTSGVVRLLDLFCGAGGAAMGYHRAGFTDIVGVDINPQPRYPFTFVLGDALEYVAAHGHEFDAIHASPPCQHYSRATAHLARGDHGRFIEASRVALMHSGLPYVIENVMGAPLHFPIILCGAMFGLESYRHRAFESNQWLRRPEHPHHAIPTSRAGHWKPGTFVSVAGNFAPIALSRRALGIEWMKRSELAEAIPPAYTEFIGRQLLMALEQDRG